MKYFALVLVSIFAIDLCAGVEVGDVPTLKQIDSLKPHISSETVDSLYELHAIGNGLKSIDGEHISNAVHVMGGAFAGAFACEAAKDAYKAAKEYVKKEWEGTYRDRWEGRFNSFHDVENGLSNSYFDLN